MTPLSSIQVDEARLIPLEAILASQDLKPHREGTTTRYKNDQFNIVVNNHGLWFDNAASIGGRGAIDLALHLRCNVQPRLATPAQIHKAIEWLGSLVNVSVSPTTEPASSTATPKESFTSQSARLAIRDDARWPLVRNYLVRGRRLPLDLVEQLHERGDIYATFTENHPQQTGACFVHRNFGGAIRGATIRTIASGSGFLYSIGEKQGAWFTVGDPKSTSSLVVVEAPIDAVSFQALRCGPETTVVATSCSHVFRPILQAAHERGWALTVALDNDRAGHAGSERCLAEYAALYPADQLPHRQCPVLKDWNDDLRAAINLCRGRGL